LLPHHHTALALLEKGAQRRQIIIAGAQLDSINAVLPQYPYGFR